MKKNLKKPFSKIFDSSYSHALRFKRRLERAFDIEMSVPFEKFDEFFKSKK